MIVIASLIVDYVDDNIKLGGVFNAPKLYDDLILMCDKDDRFLVDTSKCTCVPGRTLRVRYERTRGGSLVSDKKRYEIIERTSSGRKTRTTDIMPFIKETKVILVYEYEDQPLVKIVEKIANMNIANFVVVATRWPERYVKIPVVTISNEEEIKFMPIATGSKKIMYNGFLPVEEKKLRTNVGCGDVFAMYVSYYLEITANIRLACSLAHEKTVDYLE